MCQVYIVECSDGSLYTGWTKNIDRRIKQHNRGQGGKYTRSRMPVILKYTESFETKSDAMKRECQLKKLTRYEKLTLFNPTTKR